MYHGMSNSLSVRISATSTFSDADCQPLLDFADQRGVGDAFLAPRLKRYPHIIQAHTDAGELAAFLLFERHPNDVRDLIYLGPLVSRRRAYAPLFRSLVAELLKLNRPFWCAAEVENPKVFSALASLLPRSSYPSSSALEPSVVRRALSAFAEVVPHVHGFNPETLESEREEPMTEAELTRYRWLLFGWDGTSSGASALRDELSARDARRVA